MRKFTKILCILLTVILGCSVFTACGGDSKGDSNATEITIMNTDGGIGRAWLDNAAARFAEKVKETSYEDGKSGVKIDITVNMNTGVNSMNTSGYNIYFDSGTSSTLALSQSNFLVDISDIVTEKLTDYGESRSIEDKIIESYRVTCQGADGKYYAIPHFALHPGLTYDVELFTSENMFLAAPDAAEADKDVYTAGGIGSATFLKTSDNPNGKKSCGNDGKYGTADDGLPTSMVEFFILCHRLNYEGIEPIALAGKQVSYSNYLFDALWASLSGGYSEAETRYTLSGEADYVVYSLSDGEEYKDYNYSANYENEPVWSGLSIEECGRKPKTEKISISKDVDGYRSNDSVARYYAISAINVIEKMGWISQNSRTGTVSHTDGMEQFLLNGKMGNKKQAMFIEGDYWYNEAMDNAKTALYAKLNPDSPEKKVAWMTLPTHAYESVTGPENAREYVMTNTSACYSFINANITNQGVLQACKDFLQFCYTDSELSYFTGLTGVSRAGMDYQVLDEHSNLLSFYHKSVLAVKNDANTKVLNATKDPLYNGAIVYPTINGKKYGSYLNVIRADSSASVEDMFEQSRTAKKGWGTANL